MFRMENYASHGRISKQAFLWSSGVLLAVCIIAAFARFWIRLSIQRQFSTDDFFLILGMAFLIAGMSMVYNCINELLFFGSLRTDAGFSPSLFTEDLQQAAFRYQQNLAIACMLTWGAIVCVKMSFLFFFKRLLNRMETMLVYWYFVLGFTLVISVYGSLVFFLPCPYFYDKRSFMCNQGAKADLTFNYSMPSMIFDIVSDVMILAIPIRLLWQIRIHFMQKIAISSSLCLTIIIIVVTIIRASGIRAGDTIDSVWETYWQIISAEVGLIMTSATAFRTFFVARTAAQERRRVQDLQQQGGWTSRVRKIQLPSAVSLKTLRTSQSTNDVQDVERLSENQSW